MIKISIYQIVNEHTKKLPFYIHSIGCDIYQNPVYRPSGFPYNHMITVLEGDGFFECEDICEEITAGDIFFIKKDVPHAYYSYGNNFKTQWITFDGVSCESVFQSQNIKKYKVLKDVNIEKLNADFDFLYNKNQQYINGYELSVHIYSYIINFLTAQKKLIYLIKCKMLLIILKSITINVFH